MSWPTRLPDVDRVDWFLVLMDLKRAGLSLSTIAGFVEVGKSTVIGWKNHYCEPGYQHGERVLMLWQRASGRGPGDVPRERDLTTVRPGEPSPEHQPVRCPTCGARAVDPRAAVAEAQPERA